MKELTLDSVILFMLFGREDFWRDVPEFLFMRAMAEDARKRVASCSACSARKEMAAATAVFVKHLVALAETCPRGLDNLRACLNRALGHRPDKVMVLYKQASKTLRLEF